MSSVAPPPKRNQMLWPLLACGGLLIAAGLGWRAIRIHASDAGVERPANGAFKYTNHLIGSSSPYLLEHAHNPVNWYPWGPEALEKAQKENKPIFLSIGYSACHWCHVMAREDFENEAIAGLLNDHFVAIKVDREQRPDIDAQYMMAVQAMTGSGGWPMSVFLTPDRKPFYGGTYFPPEEFKALLNKVVDVYTKHPEGVRAQAEGIVAALASAARLTSGGKLPEDILKQADVGLARRFDRLQGGFSQRPKFPEAPNLAFLLARYQKTGEKSLLAMVTTTLDHMGAGGIYDQIGGGFHRYSTDALWRVPHFEKMLYDQALLVDVYLEAYRLTHRPRYKQVVQETLAFVQREMHDPAGGFYSTLDADSEGEEGKFYLWTPAQTHAALGGDAALFDVLYGVTATGDLEGKSVLHLASSMDQNAALLRLTPLERTRHVNALRAKMLETRAKRVRPHLDDKVLASWNGLMLAAYAHAFATLGDEQYRQTAVASARFLTGAMMPGGQLQHSYRDGKAGIQGMLEDYAFCAHGLLALYDATHDKQWLDQGMALATRMTEQFWDAQNGGFYATTEQGDLMLRLKQSEDDATPSGNGVAAEVLARLGELTGQASWRRKGLQTVQAFQPLEARAPLAFTSLLTAYQALGAPTALLTPTSVVQLQGSEVTVKSGSALTVVLTLRIQEGWHINAHQTSAAYLIPTRLTLVGDREANLNRVQYPQGQQVRFAFAPEPLQIYRGRMELTARLKLEPSARRGRRSLHFRLDYQPCNDHACLAPSHTDCELFVDVR